jgi:Flp pilus assembly protein TadG
MEPSCPRRSSERGSGTLEFVLMLTPLLLILFGIIEVSRLFLTVGVVADAARQGARAGAVSSPFDAAGAQAQVTAVLAAANLTATKNIVACPACATGATVTASVGVAFVTPIPILVSLFGASLNVEQQAQMRAE